MNAVTIQYARAVHLFSAKWVEAIMLFFVRLSLAGIFWRSGRTKVIEGSWLSISDTTLFQFDDTPFNNVPLLPPEIAAHLTLYAEHLFPVLLVLGLFTRISALALLGMTMVIQIFVFPEAWWQVHSIWVALALVLIVRGGGQFALDRLVPKLT